MDNQLPEVGIYQILSIYWAPFGIRCWLTHRRACSRAALLRKDTNISDHFFPITTHLHTPSLLGYLNCLMRRGVTIRYQLSFLMYTSLVLWTDPVSRSLYIIALSFGPVCAALPHPAHLVKLWNLQRLRSTTAAGISRTAAVPGISAGSLVMSSTELRHGQAMLDPGPL